MTVRGMIPQAVSADELSAFPPEFRALVNKYRRQAGMGHQRAAVILVEARAAQITADILLREGQELLSQANEQVKPFGKAR